MKKAVLGLVLLCLVSLCLRAELQERPDEVLFRDAKVLIFDKNWDEALDKLDRLLTGYPESAWFSQALFYKGRCLQEQPRQEPAALRIYQEYLRRSDRNESLAEESEIAIIDLGYEMYENGETSRIKEIERRLNSSNRVVRYYAAFKLSYIEDWIIAEKSLPVLKSILKEEEDAELRDRAKIALLRIDPEELDDVDRTTGNRAKILKIRVFRKGVKQPELSLNIPWALADLALSAIPVEDRAEMRKEGYDLDKIIRELTEVKGNIISIQSEEKLIKLWIE